MGFNSGFNGLIEDPRSVDFLLLSRPPIFGKYFSAHDGARVLKHKRFLLEYILAFLARNVACSHKLYLSVPPSQIILHGFKFGDLGGHIPRVVNHIL